MLAEAGWVVQDAAAFDFSAGPGVALRQYDVHTLLRLPTGIFYAQGVKANVLFFERDPLTLSSLEDFIACYNPEARHNPEESERFRSFAYDELAGRDKTNLDIFWLKDDSLEDTENLPPPDVLASTVVENRGLHWSSSAGSRRSRRAEHTFTLGARTVPEVHHARNGRDETWCKADVTSRKEARRKTVSARGHATCTAAVV